MNGVSVDDAAVRHNHNDGNDKNYRRYTYNGTYRCVHVTIVVVGI